MRQNLLKLFLEDESGVTVIEIVLILVVLIGLVIIFKNQLNSLIQSLLDNKTKQFYLTGGFICEEMQRKYDDYDVPDFFYPALSSPLGYSAFPNSGRTDSGNACSRYRYLFYFRPI